MLNHFRESLPKFELAVGKLLNAQCLDDNSECFGVVPNFAKGFNEPGEGCGCATTFVTAYYNPYTKWYKNSELLHRAKIAMAYSLAHTNDDGTIDLMETNFHDSTSNAFSIQNLAPAYLLLQKFTEHTEAEEEVGDMIREFLKRSARAMVNCGFHTPNHRWVVSSALAYCYNILGDEKCLIHLNKFLAEGIDNDENGEYTERSAGVYNIACNNSLIIIGKELNMPEMFDHVTRNLMMVLKYIEPDDTINTMNSTRQDFGTEPPFEKYTDNYLRMALITGNAEFAWVADYLLKKTGHACSMIPFLMDPALEQKMLAQKTLKPSFEYEKLFVESGILRKREGDATLTLVKERPLFAKLQFADKRMYIRFAGSFFGPLAQFVPQTLTPIDGGYRLTYHQTWGYKRPLEVPQGTSNWREMDHTKRADVCMQDFDVSFDIRMYDKKLEIELTAGGCDNIPVKLELMFDAGGILASDSVDMFTREGDYVFLNHGHAAYTFDNHVKFIVDGGFRTHHYAKNMRGSIQGDPKAFTIAMTGLTPQNRTVTVKYGTDQTI
ncbi:MAG TPA: hypothetical protein PK629_00935 [Oscillospiraceae bacterium]|nr:hypothetical protein [Oscillospiraceae bacterium]HPF55850.1 hypothetical protein [Clostridiales bacterium]HPK34493.1 hypothetical protein [Oscillospiraceae bacterium]HPR74721.1 hypothetical protein [Oscillospiraceae bacterium]